MEQLPRKIVPGYDRAYQGGLDTNVLGGMVFLFNQISPEYFVPTTCNQFIFFPSTE